MRKLFIAVGLAIMPTIAAAQQATTPDARLQAALSTAEEAGIPTSLLQSKIDEGRAKGVDETRIAAAVEARLQGLESAKAALAAAGARNLSAGELSLAADAVQAGVSATAVGAVMAKSPEDRRAVATAVLTELVQGGMASEMALERVQAAAAQGGRALMDLPAQASAHAHGAVHDGMDDSSTPGEVDAGARTGVTVGGSGRGRSPN